MTMTRKRRRAVEAAVKESAVTESNALAFELAGQIPVRMQVDQTVIGMRRRRMVRTRTSSMQAGRERLEGQNPREFEIARFEKADTERAEAAVFEDGLGQNGGKSKKMMMRRKLQ